MKQIRFLLIGCGAVSEVLYKPAFHHIRKKGIGELVAVVDINLSRAKEYAAEFHAKAYDNLETALKNEKLDAAVVATPHAFHAPVTIQCFDAGLAVLCEKPLGISRQECETMIAAAKKAGRPLEVGFFRRYFPSTRAIKLLIEREALGPVRSFEFFEGEKYSWPAKTTSFFSRPVSGGGVLIDAGTHLLDLLLWWLGDACHVDYMDDAMGGVEANCDIRITMANGVAGRIRMSREYPLDNQYIIHCENGDLIYRCDVVDRIFFRRGKERAMEELDLQKARHFGELEMPFQSDAYRFSFIGCFFEQLERFCTIAGDPFPVSGRLERAVKGIDLIETCYSHKKFWGMPWLQEHENVRAMQLSRESDYPAGSPEDIKGIKIKVGVIGAGGFVGYRLCEWLILNNLAEVIPIIHTARNFALLGRFDIRAEIADLLDPASLERSFAGKDVIVHAAVGDEETIVAGIENTLRAAKNAGIKRVIYISTVCVHGNAPDTGTDENSPLLTNQKYPYNRSKVRAEEIVRRLRDELHLDVVVLRPLIIWGPRSQYWITNLSESIKRKDAFLVNGGEGICNCTYIDNVIEAVYLAITKSEAKNQDFIIMDNETVTWRKYYEAIAGILGAGNSHWRNLTLDELAAERERNRTFEKRMRVRKLFLRIGAKILPGPVKRWIQDFFPRISDCTQPGIDEEIASLQQAGYKLSSGKAKRILGYEGKVSFSAGMEATQKWMTFVHYSDLR